MTPAALIVFGAVAYFVFRLRFVILSFIWDMTPIGRAAIRKKKRMEQRRRERNEVHFFTVEQVWGEDEKEKRSA